MKDVYNWKLYCDLKNSFVKVDYTQKLNDDSKNRFCEEIKKIKPEVIKNTIFVEKKYTIWERMKRVLGIN